MLTKCVSDRVRIVRNPKNGIGHFAIWRKRKSHLATIPYSKGEFQIHKSSIVIFLHEYQLPYFKMRFIGSFNNDIDMPNNEISQ